MESLINLQHVLAALHCASCEGTRFYMQGVCIEIRDRESFAVATDGHVLFASHFALEPDAPANALLGSFILHRDGLKAIKLRRIINPASTMTRLDAATVKIVCDVQDFYAKLIDGTFPDWRRAVPNDGPLAEAAEKMDTLDFNSRKLEAFWKCAKALDSTVGGSGNPFRIARNGYGPALVRFGDPDAIGMIMPYGTDAKRGARPSWI